MSVVLVIDDDETIQEVLTDILEEEDYQVVTLSSTANLEKTLDSVKPACILMDVMLPGEDGDVAVKRLKKDDVYKNTPILLMSAGSDVVAKAIDSRADGYLKKPFNYNQVLQFIEEKVGLN